MFHYRQHAGSHETRSADHASTAVQLSNLDGRAGTANLYAAPGLGGFDDILPGSAVAGVDQDFDKISFRHYVFIYSHFGRYLNVAQPPPKPQNL